MKRKKGFTLVELLAVIVILAAIMVIAIPAVLEAKERAMGALSKEQMKNLQDAGKLLGVDLDDYATDIYDCKDGSWIRTSSGAKCERTSEGWIEVTIDIQTLVEHGYFKSDTPTLEEHGYLKIDNNHCIGSITIDRTNTGYKVTNNDVKCVN